jgi:hypothetical protein
MLLEKWLSPWSRQELYPYFLPCTKINSKWIKDLNLRPETLKLLQKHIEKTLDDIRTRNKFLNKTLIAQEIRARITN